MDLPGRYGPIAALHAKASIDGNAMATALLLPGYTGSKEDFAPLLDPITHAGIDAIAIDLPGQHESGGPDDESAYLPSSLGHVVAELVGKLAAEGQWVLLLGHSFGGLVARAAVLAGAPVAGLTLMDCGPGELPPGWRRQMLDLGEPVVREHGLAAALALRERLDAQNAAWVSHPEPLKDFLRTRFLRSHPACLLGMAQGLRTEPDQVGALARVMQSAGIPGLVMCGIADDAWPVSAQRDMADRLDADFAAIPGSRHAPNLENPEMVLDTLIPTWRTWLFYG